MATKQDLYVVKVIETGKIVINKGIQDGIYPHHEFLVYEEGEEIFDPITKKSLGALENPKGTFKTMHVQDKMAILVSKKKIPSQIALSIAGPFGESDAEYESLKSINIGDKVKIINEI